LDDIGNDTFTNPLDLGLVPFKMLESFEIVGYDAEKLGGGG
jgi:hypothetical protein